MAERTSPALTAGLRRYSRHLLIPEVGVEGQRRLASARVLCIGAGGLGAPVLAYLAAAGVGRIGIVDDDRVDESNLQRQTIFSTSDIGKLKAHVAAQRVVDLNPLVAADPIPVRFDASNASELVRLYDVIVDCTDRFTSRYAINDACWFEGKPDVYASIFRFDGQVSVFWRDRGPCYRCLFSQPPPAGSVPTCAEGGVLGVLAGIVGTWQANEALKIILGIGEPLVGRLMLIDALGSQVREFAIERDAQCALCGNSPSITAVREEDEDSAAPPDAQEVQPAELDEALNGAVLLDVRERHEAVLGVLENAIHIPASELQARLHELDSAKSYVVACRVGSKSRWAIQLLRDAGFTRVTHLNGGLLGYAALDPGFAFF
ncbi:MAG TPA: molybdopterin-synthase adenylyltransferase MoeB [Candidatus Baltobacteraceae bacterium]|jgi:adenylyltransferase/sulfurtransferase|nr:molybdopterin-synthase adenylyltransferase MoeB [Candidatus Baltobacteraceae bacterium]